RFLFPFSLSVFFPFSFSSLASFSGYPAANSSPRYMVMDVFHMHCVSAFVLDEDGTGVDTEDFFQTLKGNTVLMVLRKGQKWAPQQHMLVFSTGQAEKTYPRKDVAKLTIDLYKNHPQDFIGCLNVQATLYGMYSVSYDLQCYKAKRMLREALKWTLFTMQTTGHVLVGTSCYIHQHRPLARTPWKKRFFFISMGPSWKNKA
uniref:Cell death inducing DFFA like effector c n=1 Tax=Sinocyclocheilus rhinocerous TaxID=307959 RepID=A0A673H6Z3_9TELE